MSRSALVPCLAPPAWDEHEWRFLPSEEERAAFWEQAAPHLARELLDPTRPVLCLRTTYFDDARSSYARSLLGPVARRLRVREIATATERSSPPRFTGECFVELKESRDSRRTKVRRAASPDLVRRWWTGDRTALDAEWLGDPTLRPALTTWFYRSAFVGEQGRLRITDDEQLVFLRPSRVADPGEQALPTEPFALGPSRILEVKCRGEPPDWLQAAVRGLRHASEFSKFAEGMRRLAEPGR